MDKDEYRAYRETMFRRQRQEDDRKDRAKRDNSYDPKKMNVERMPLGCLVVALAAAVLVLYGILKAAQVI